jgi:hypothetical protein
MAKNLIQYRDGFKYQLASQYMVTIAITPDDAVDTQYIKLDTLGTLTIVEGYAWDGTSGPVIDTAENMRASLVHDALYQLMRQRKLTAKAHKKKADKIFKNMCIEDGVSRAIAHTYYLVLKALGKPSTDPKNKRKVLKAP